LAEADDDNIAGVIDEPILTQRQKEICLSREALVSSVAGSEPYSQPQQSRMDFGKQFQMGSYIATVLGNNMANIIF
jgi:hypothetical protein